MFSASPNSLALSALFERQVERTPEAVALVLDSETLSYRELNARANRLAHRLRKLGVERDTLVALSVERSVELVVGILGILKAGGAYLPLDPSYPRDRLDFMLADSRAKLFVTHGASSALSTEQVLCVQIEDTALEPDHNLECTVEADQLCYVIYTSGSTGKPKGVLVTHENVVRLFEATHAWYGFDSADVWTLFHSCAFDFSVWELWGALLHGGKLVIVPYALSRSPDDFWRLLAREGVTVLNQTPSAFRQLAQAALSQQQPAALALRYVIFGGEALELQGLRAWFERFGDQQPRLVNMYGITETTVHVTYRPIGWQDVHAGLGSVIGVPIPDLGIHLLDAQQSPVAEGEAGEIYVSGAGLARGYLNRPELTAQRFVTLAPSPVTAPTRLYRTGDLARRLPNGEFEYLGRIDQQVKLRGFRIELGEIESAIAEHPAVSEVVVVVREDNPGDKRLVAYLASPEGSELMEALRAALRTRLPEHMVPAAFVMLPKLPLTENGKVDRAALPAPAETRPDLDTEYEEPSGALERRIAALWQRLLRIDRVGANDRFFDLGGSSLLAVESLVELRRELGRSVPTMLLFEHPSARALAAALEDTHSQKAASETATLPRPLRSSVVEPIAIVGMAGRFPGARNVHELWQKLQGGRELVRFFDDAELDPRCAADAGDPRYVKARGVLEDADCFDAGFFGETRAQAELMDPQQRVLLEVAVAALEDAGIVPERHGNLIGVFAGTGHNTYLLKNVVQRGDRIAALGDLALILSNDKDFVATRIAHRLGLTGPALSVHTACSTSLVAVCQAVRSLLDHECDAALAGAASVTVPQHAGHLHVAGAMLSADGHTRSFDAAATGTVFSDGAGMVVLKRRSDAERDGDRIYALIRATAINNDGGDKASFTAPSVAGQAAVIARAHAAADIDPETISYVEAHGTATALGDPIEVEALTRAFRMRTERRGFCALGTIKSNLGHLTAASGVAGLIKTALCLHHRALVPSLFFEQPNPSIDFAATPFYVQTRAEPWPPSAAQLPRRAGVSSFGVGGTNAHVVLEEASRHERAATPRPLELLLLSAKSATALARAADELSAHLAQQPSEALADVAYTLQSRRQHFAQRLYVVCSDRDQAIAQLQRPAQARKLTRRDTPVAFVFPGQGAQYAGMGRELYAHEPVFKRCVDRCAELFLPELGHDIRELLCATDSELASVEVQLQQTALAQPALFTLEYALATLWLSWGVTPCALSGHSIGEFVAATLAGVFSEGSAVALVAQRGRLMQSMPSGSMLSVRASAERIAARIAEPLALAAINSPKLCVISGPTQPLEALRSQLESEGIAVKRLKTAHAFHSAMMDPVIEPFAALVREAAPRAPRIPIVSTATGALLSDQQATDPRYWAEQLRVPVQFTSALRTLWLDPSRVLLEVGPGFSSALSAKQLVRERAEQAFASLDTSPAGEWRALNEALGRLWLAGVPIDWAALQGHTARTPCALPSYPFARERHWLEPTHAVAAERPSNAAARELSAGSTAQVLQPLAAAESGAADPEALAQIFATQLNLMQAQLAALSRSADDEAPEPHVG
jgi:amino acid adenylation domain-containing protein